jgi:hypothetical protein
MTGVTHVHMCKIARYGATVTSRAPVFLAVFVVVSSWNETASATDKAQCAAAAEVGQRLTKAHKLVAAREQLLLCSSKECPDVISQDCTQWLGEVERSVASVVLKPVDDTGRRLDNVHVTENGVVIAEHAGESAVEVDPGTHVFHFERSDLVPADQNAQLDEGRRNQEIVVTMKPRPVAPPPPPPPVHETASGGGGFLAGAIATTTLAVAGGALFAGFGASGVSDENALRKSCAPFCTSSDVSPVSTKFAIADAAIITGGVAAIAAIVFWVVWGQHRSPEKHVGFDLPWRGPAFGGSLDGVRLTF